MTEHDAEKKNYFSDNDSILEAGEYRAKLVRLLPGVGRSYDGKPPRETLTFSFLEPKSGAVINRTVSRSRHERSKMVELVRSMSGFKQPGPNVMQSGEAFTNYLNSLVDKTFLVRVEPSNNGLYNNLVAVQPGTNKN